MLKVALVKLPAYVHSSQKIEQNAAQNSFVQQNINNFNAQKCVAVNISSVQIKNCKRYGVA